MRPRPCSPGGYERRSIAHFSVRQRSPLRNSFIPWRRHCLHFGERSRAVSGHLAAGAGAGAAKRRSRKDAGSVRSRRLRARPRTRRERPLQPARACEAGGRGPPSNTPPLPRTHAVVGLRRHVLDAEDLEPRSLQRTDRGFAAGARPFHEDLDLLEAMLHALARTRIGGDLRRERRRLARALEAGRAGGLPRDHVAVLVGERDDRVVERRLDVRLADRDVLLDAPTCAAPGRRLPGRGHYFAFFPRPTVLAGPFRVRAFVRVRWPWTGRPRRWRMPRYAPISPSRLIAWERSRRRSPSTWTFSSMYARRFDTSSSVRSRIFVSGSRASEAATLRAVGWPIP